MEVNNLNLFIYERHVYYYEKNVNFINIWNMPVVQNIHFLIFKKRFLSVEVC